MKHRLFNSFSALPILLLVALNKPQAQSIQHDNRPRTGSLSGRVTVGGAPAANALVMVMEVDPSNPWYRSDLQQSAFIKVRTDESGLYRITGLPQGSYVINALSKAYVRTDYSRDYFNFRSINLDDGESREDLNITLVRGGVITGRVADAEGRPLIKSFLRLEPVAENG